MESSPENRVVSVILAGGRGTRMRNDSKHKVCFEVGGIPIILRALANYQACGINHHIIVVGALGEQVLHTVGARMPNVSFAYQPEPRGTGNAARCGVRMLQDTGYDGLVFVVVGDRLVAPHIMHRLADTMRETGSDLVFLVGRKEDNPTSGRVVYDGDGNAAAIVETSEIALSSVVAELEALCEAADAPVSPETVLECIRRRFSSDQKARKACGELFTRSASGEALAADEMRALLAPLRESTTLTLWMDGEPTSVAAADVEAGATEANLSGYLFRAAALYEALESLSSDNAQGEEYLTDCIKYMASSRIRNGRPRFRVRTVCVDNPDDSMGFNTPEELAEIERRLRLGEHGSENCEEPESIEANGALRPAGEWRRIFTENGPDMQALFATIYGPAPDLHEAKRGEFLAVLDEFIRLHGEDREAFIVRSPGRINLMGRHIDHRGGNTNVIAISDEILMVAAPRQDDHITLANTLDSVFERREFSISRDIASLDWSDWLTCVNSPKTLALVSGGDWSHYVRAAALRLQERFRGTPLFGADIVTHGTIPVGSGLSSSSAVVVGAAEVLVAVNHLPVRPNIMVDLCGEGEWFVGTRGGAADHAAIKCCRRGQVAHVGFFPFEICEFLSFFEGKSVVVCNSGVQAKKNQGARYTYNKRVLEYVAGEAIIRQLMPEFAPSIHHLRDVRPENLGISLVDLYEILKQIPIEITRKGLLERYGPFDAEATRKIKDLLNTLGDGEVVLNIRGVVLYGLAEVERAKRCIEHLRSGDAEGFGRLWFISHDGDRVVSHDDHLREVPWEYEVSDDYLDALTADLRSGEPERIARAQIHLQPGKYACSTREIDLIVDIARRQPGVLGAQIAGAGLGGCCMVLADDDACEPLIAELAEHGFAAKRYCSVEGAGIISPGEAEGVCKP